MEAHAFFLRPSLEGRGRWHVEALQERTAYEPGRRRTITSRERRSKRRDVGRDRRSVEAEQEVGADDLVADLVPERVQRLAKRVASALFVSIGPEQPCQSLAGNAAVPLGGEHCQDGEPLCAEPWCDSLVDGFERESAERHEVQHQR